MPSMKRHKTRYPGVYYIEGTGADGKPEKVFYIYYWRGGKKVEEKAGRQRKNDMTAARAAQIRSRKIEGKELPNTERREEDHRSESWTISKLWEHYKTTRSLKGIVTDENRFQNHLSPVFGNREPHEIEPHEVDGLRVKMLKTHSPATVRNALELLRRIVNFGVKRRLCQGLSFTIELPPANNIKTEDLTAEELSRLIAAIDAEPDTQIANFMRLVLYTGMRRGELFRLKWEHIDFERRFVRIVDPKGGQDMTIPLNEPARILLESHQRTGSPYVFPGKGGKQRVDIKKAVNRVKERAGLPKNFRALHGLRHVYASALASSGKVDMYTLQRLLTHKSPQMTARYAHLRDEALRRASDLIGEILPNGGG